MMAADGDDAEFAAIQTIYKALEPLDDDGRGRVLAYILSRLEITIGSAASPSRQRQVEPSAEEEASIQKEQADAPKFGSLAELADAAQPSTNPERALVAGYWLQVCQGSETFDGFSVNKELKNLGHPIANITNAIEALKAQSPALAIQLKKSGKSKQARKTYKLTVAGIKAVEASIKGQVQ